MGWTELHQRFIWLWHMLFIDDEVLKVWRPLWIHFWVYILCNNLWNLLVFVNFMFLWKLHSRETKRWALKIAWGEGDTFLSWFFFFLFSWVAHLGWSFSTSWIEFGSIFSGCHELSQVGCEVLIKVVFQVILVYVMCC